MSWLALAWLVACSPTKKEGEEPRPELFLEVEGNGGTVVAGGEYSWDVRLSWSGFTPERVVLTGLGDTHAEPFPQDEEGLLLLDHPSTVVEANDTDRTGAFIESLWATEYLEDVMAHASLRYFSVENCVEPLKAFYDAGVATLPAVVVVPLVPCHPLGADVSAVFVEAPGWLVEPLSGPLVDPIELQVVATEDAGPINLLHVHLSNGMQLETYLYVNSCEDGDPRLYDTDGDGVSDCGVPISDEWRDVDGDGFAPMDGDCNDFIAEVHPRAFDGIDGRDDDCDGLVDEDEDPDLDGAVGTEDCDETNPFTRVGAIELCDGLDNDCDGLIERDGDCL